MFLFLFIFFCILSYVEKVTEIDNIDDQIKFELLTIIENNFVINKCEYCKKLFIPITSSNNKNKKAQTVQKYCNNLYLDTSKTCKQIGALNKIKQKVENSPIFSEFQREYKRMYGLHYNHSKKFNDWSKKAKKLTTKYNDEQVDEFKIGRYIDIIQIDFNNFLYTLLNYL